MITEINGRTEEQLLALQKELQNTFCQFTSELIDQNDNCKKIAVDKKLKAVADQKIEELKEAIEARQADITVASKAFNQTIDDLITGIDGSNEEELVALQKELQNTFCQFTSS